MNQVCAARLCDLPVGARTTIHELRAAGAMRRRLCDLGFLPGVTVRCVGIAPMGDPKAYEVRGAIIALRARDGAAVLTEACRE